MQFQRIASTALTLVLLLNTTGVTQEGTAITWESFKEIEFDFGDNLLRVGSDYQTYAYATGAPTNWLSSYPSPEYTEITSEITTDFASAQASSPGATSSAVAGWLLDKDDASGIATLSNAAAGTTAIVDKHNPTVVAMSWAAQSTSLELGEEVSQGVIDWSPGIMVGAYGGSFISSQDSISIHDPIVIWTRDANTGVSERTTLFELTAEFDSKTEIHWNQVRQIRAGIDGRPELVLVPNDGPFLNAADDGSGSFRLRLDSNLLPAAQRGTLAVDFKDGFVTASTATGVFSDLAPSANGAVLGRLPQVGSRAIIESLLVDNNDKNGRFALSVDVGQDRVITDVAACSDGVHVSVGAGVDTIQTFTLNPLQRSPVNQVNSAGQNESLLGPCLGDVREDAELLFGSSYAPTTGASLHAESATNPIDRFVRLNVGPKAPQQTIVFDQGDNTAPADTRRWAAKFDVRLMDLPGPLPIQPTSVAPTKEAVGDVIGDRQPSLTVETSGPDAIEGTGAGARTSGAGNTVGAIDSTGSTFAIGLLDVATYGAASTQEGAVAASDQEISLFRKTDGIVLTVTERPNITIARLAIDGNVIAVADIPLKYRLLSRAKDTWQHFELELQQQHAGVDVQLNLASDVGDEVLSVIDTTIPRMKLSPDGYRLAIGSLDNSDDLAHDFDNLTTTFQQTGDIAWDGTVDVEDFRLLGRAINSKVTASIFDIDLNGQIDFGDLELIEDLIPNKTPGDANFDDIINFSDFLALSAFFGQSTGLWSRGDFDSSGRVEFKDFLLLARNYGNADMRRSQLVPEPASITMLLLGVCALGRLRRAGRCGDDG